MSFRHRLKPAALGSLLIAGLAVLPAWAQSEDEDETPRGPAQVEELRSESRLPLQELTNETLYQFLLGEVANQRGNAGIAAQTYLVIAKRTKDPRIARRAVEIATQARISDIALESAKVWHESDPGSAQALQTISVLLVSMQRVREAEPYIAKLIGLDGDSPAGVFLRLGRLLASNPDKAANLAVVRELVKRHPDIAEAQFSLAQAAMLARNEALALDAIRRAAELRPGWEVPALFEAQVLQRNSPARASERLAAHLARYPDALEVRLAHARTLIGEKRYPEARAEFNWLLASSGEPEIIYAAGLLAFQMRDLDIAEQSMKRVLDSGYRDISAARFVLGQIAEERKDWSGAIEWYRGISRGERALPARLRTAQALVKLGRLDEARAYLRNAAQTNTEQQAQFVIAEAQLLRDANRTSEAFGLLNEALAKTPDQPEILYDLALTAEKIERHDAMEAHLRRLIQLQPENAHAYNALGYSFADRNVRLPEARRLIEKAVELAPEDMFILDSLGWVLYRMGDLKAAIVHLTRAWTERQDAEIGAHLGEVLWVAGQRAEAERVWKDSLANHPESDLLRNTVRRFKP